MGNTIEQRPGYVGINVTGIDTPLYFPETMSRDEIAAAIKTRPEFKVNDAGAGKVVDIPEPVGKIERPDAISNDDPNVKWMMVDTDEIDTRTSRPVRKLMPVPVEKPEPRTIAEREEKLEGPQPLRQKIANTVRPWLKAAGGTVGAIVAAPLAPETLGGSTVAAGSLGYAMGDKIADIIDGRDRGIVGEFADTGRDLLEGATYEMGGQAAGVILRPVFQGGKWVFQKVKNTGLDLTKKGMEKKAGELLIARTSDGPIFAANAEEAAALEKEIPGLKFSMGQRSSDPRMIQLERAQMRKPGDASYFSAEQTAQNNEALRRYYEKGIPGNQDDFIGAVEKQNRSLTKNSEVTTANVREMSAELPTSEPQIAGNRIIEAIEREKEPIQSAMWKLEAEIPDYPMAMDNTRDLIRKVAGDKKLSMDQKKAVKQFGHHLDELTGSGETTHTVFGINRTLNDAITRAYARGEDSTAAILLKIKNEGVHADLAKMSELARTGKIIDYNGTAINADKLAAELEKNLTRIAEIEASTGTPDIKKMQAALKASGMPVMKQKGETGQGYAERIGKDYTRLTGEAVPMENTGQQAAVDALVKRNDEIRAVLQKASPGQDVGAAMRAYNDFASNQYFGRFDRGKVAQAKPGGNMRAEHLPAAFKTPSGADDLIKAMGSKSKAADLVRDELNYDLLSNTTDRNGLVNKSKLDAWLKKNRIVLRKYGLTDNYSTFSNAVNEADAARAGFDAWQKSSAAKALGADPEKMFQATLTGANIGTKARSMVQAVHGDENALRGLQKSFADHLMNVSQTTAKDISGNPMISAAQLTRTWEKYVPAMREIYSGEPMKIKALENMNKAFQIMARNTRSPIGHGSDTAENLANQLFYAISPKTKTIRFMGEFIRPLKDRSEREITRYINRALFDPDYAENLINAARVKISPETFRRRLDAQMKQLGRAATMAAMATDDDDNEE